MSEEAFSLDFLSSLMNVCVIQMFITIADIQCIFCGFYCHSFFFLTNSNTWLGYSTDLAKMAFHNTVTNSCVRNNNNKGVTRCSSRPIFFPDVCKYLYLKRKHYIRMIVTIIPSAIFAT